MCDVTLDEVGLDVGSGDEVVHLALRHCVPSGGARSLQERKPVLLLHGASASHRTFLTPEGHGLANVLAEEFDPWLLDWRGSRLVVEAKGNQTSLDMRGDIYNFNRAASEDVVAAITAIRSVRTDWTKPMAGIGHCMGGGVLAEAIARDLVEPKGAIDCVVLLTLGLFYETSPDSRLKSELRLLEQFAAAGTKALNPADTKTVARWPKDLEELYVQWPGRLRAHEDDDGASGLCNRLAFMYGMPYEHANLVASVHGSGSDALSNQFGAIPLHMFIHAARNVREGHATVYDRRPVSDPLSPEAPARFADLARITLITGERNHLWHRDSIDRMHDWLGRHQPPITCEKHVLPEYGHQDLLWGRHSRDDVYPLIAKGLRADERDLAAPTEKTSASTLASGA